MNVTEWIATTRTAPDVPEARWGVADWLEEYGTEDDFAAWLDAFPHHHDVRALFGRWLSARGDGRGEGYQALAAGRHFVGTSPSFPFWWGHVENIDGIPPENVGAKLPMDWFGLVESPMKSGGTWWRDYSDRRTAEDAAARAFAKLPLNRRRELLAAAEVPT